MQLDIGMVFSSLIGLFLLMGVGWVSVKTKIVPPAASAPMSSLLLKVTPALHHLLLPGHPGV